MFGGIMSERVRTVMSRVQANEAHRQNEEDETLRTIATLDSTNI